MKTEKIEQLLKKTIKAIDEGYTFGALYILQDLLVLMREESLGD